MNENISFLLKKIKKNDASLFNKDFFHTWDFDSDEIKKTLAVAEALKLLHSSNIAVDCFETGLAVSNFRDQSTRTRFSFASAANMLGLAVEDLDESKSQITHGETVRETANMISFMAEFIGIRDDIFLGEGDRYMKEVATALDQGYAEGILHQRPGVINLQSDVDHPTQTMADLLHLKQHFGGLKKLKGKKMAITWAYSPSYGKPLSVPQGLIGLMTRLGMEVNLAFPPGYELLPDVMQIAENNAKKSGGAFRIVDSMPDAFDGADIVYPKSWAPFSVMQKRTELLKTGDKTGLQELEQICLQNNAKHTSWNCNEEFMKLTNKGEALYMHCLPADISGVSCKQGEVTESVFDKYRTQLYLQAGYKPYVIAAMMMNYKFQNVDKILKYFVKRDKKRILTNLRPSLKLSF